MAQTLDMLRDNLPRLEKTFKKTQLLYISSLIWCFDYQSWYDCGTNWQDSNPWQYKRFPCRTFVNMVPLIDVTVTLGMEDKHPFCYISHPYVCPCLYGAGKSIWGGGTPLGRWQNIYIWVSFCRAGKMAILCPFFLKVEPPCDQTWWDSLVSQFSVVSHMFCMPRTLWLDLWAHFKIP